MEIKVLFVCLGNICRSPLAEGLFRQKVVERGLDHYFRIDSSGTGDYHIGELPDPRTRANAEANGLNLTSRARQFTARDYDHFDYIIPMDSTNRSNVLSLDREGLNGEKVVLMRRFDPEDVDADVPDPYFGGERGFQDVFDILDRSTTQFLDWLTERHDLK